MLQKLLCPHSSLEQNFRIFWVGMHFGGNIEAISYCAIKSVIFKHVYPVLHALLQGFVSSYCLLR